MYHSITIGTNLFSTDGSLPRNAKNTWVDWHLIPATRPLVNPPKAKLSLIEIPGADGTLDLTNVLTGRPTYSDRTGSWSFYVENGYGAWSDKFSEIMMYLHGKSLQCYLEDDPTYFYEGRFTVNQWRSDPTHSMIVIDYQLGPYKRYSLADEDNWLWDPFYFGDPRFPDQDPGDEIKNYKNMRVPNTDGTPLVVTIRGDYQDVVPVITTSSRGVILEYNGTRYALTDGININNDVVLTNGQNILTFTYPYGSTTISIKIEGGRL